MLVFLSSTVRITSLLFLPSVEYGLSLDRDRHERHVEDELAALGVDAGPLEPMQSLAVGQRDHLRRGVRRAPPVRLELRRNLARRQVLTRAAIRPFRWRRNEATGFAAQ
jgi:hypothetical protein